MADIMMMLMASTIFEITSYDRICGQLGGVGARTEHQLEDICGRKSEVQGRR